MEIFISHSMIDKDLVNSLKINLELKGFKLFIAEHYHDIEKTITEKIESMIKQSHVALVLLTENGFKSNFVQQEIGYLKSLNKPFLLIVQKGLEGKMGGFAYGKDAIILDPLDSSIALKKVEKLLLDFWNKRDNEKKQMEEIDYKKNQAQRKKKLALLGAGILLLLGLSEE